MLTGEDLLWVKFQVEQHIQKGENLLSDANEHIDEYFEDEDDALLHISTLTLLLFTMRDRLVRVDEAIKNSEDIIHTEKAS